MNTSRKAIEWLTCFSVVNLTFGCLLFKNFKSLNNIVPFQKQLKCDLTNKIGFVRIILI